MTEQQLIWEKYQNASLTIHRSTCPSCKRCQICFSNSHSLKRRLLKGHFLFMRTHNVIVLVAVSNRRPGRECRSDCVYANNGHDAHGFLKIRVATWAFMTVFERTVRKAWVNLIKELKWFELRRSLLNLSRYGLV